MPNEDEQHESEVLRRKTKVEDEQHESEVLRRKTKVEDEDETDFISVMIVDGSIISSTGPIK
jgi:hypothetical protein